MFQHFAQSQPQPLQLCPGEPRGPLARSDSGAKEAFICVNIAYSSQEFLVEKSSLDGQFSPVEESSKFVRIDGQRLGSRSAEGRIASQIAKLEAPKASRVNKAQLPAVSQAQTRVRMGRNRSFRGGDQQPTGHAKVHNPLGLRNGLRHCQRASVCSRILAGSSQLANYVFSGAMYSQNGAPFKAFGQPRRRSLERLSMRTKPGLDDELASHPVMNTACNGFHFRQFGHSSIVWE